MSKRSRACLQACGVTIPVKKQVPLPQQVLTQHQHGKVLGWLQGLPQLSGEYSLEVPESEVRFTLKKKSDTVKSFQSPRGKKKKIFEQPDATVQNGDIVHAPAKIRVLENEKKLRKEVNTGNIKKSFVRKLEFPVRKGNAENIKKTDERVRSVMNLEDSQFKNHSSVGVDVARNVSADGDINIDFLKCEVNHPHNVDIVPPTPEKLDNETPSSASPPGLPKNILDSYHGVNAEVDIVPPTPEKLDNETPSSASPPGLPKKIVDSYYGVNAEVMACGEIPVGERADCPLKMNLDPPWMTPADNITNSIYCDQLSIAGTQFLNPIDVSFKTDNTGKSAKNLMWPGVGNNIMDCFKESNCEAMCSGEFPVVKEPKGPLMMNLDPPFKTPADNSSNIINREQLPIAGAKYSNTIGVSLSTDKPGYSSACNLVWPGVANTFVDSFNEPNSEGIITDDIPVGQEAEGPLMMNLDLSFIAPTDQTSENIQLAQLSIAECEIHHTTPIDSKMQKAGYMSVSNLVSLGAASSIPDVLDEGNGEGMHGGDIHVETLPDGSLMMDLDPQIFSAPKENTSGHIDEVNTSNSLESVMQDPLSMAGDFEHQEATYESCVPDFDIYDPDFDPDFNPQRATRENGPNILQVNEIQPGEVIEAANNSLESDTDVEDAAPVHRKRQYNAPLKLTRKRQRNQDAWKLSVARRLKQSGQEYVNTKGQIVPAKAVGHGCRVDCRFKCHTRVTQRQREEIHKQYYSKVQNSKDTWQYICMHVKKVPKKEATRGDDSRRNFSFKYTFRVNGSDVPVCKTMFLSTLSISNTVVETAFSKLGEGGSISPSKVGKTRTKNPRAIPEELKNSVRQHIGLFPKVESHYVRKDTQREYLDEKLNISVMHKAYLQWISNKDKDLEGPELEIDQDSDIMDDTSSVGDVMDEPGEDNIGDSIDGNDIVIRDPLVATERQYRDIFNNEFNLGFHQPKKDQCDVCVVYNLAEGDAKENLREEFENHHQEKEKVRALKKIAKEKALNNASVAFCCFDLQRVLYVPDGHASGFFYNSKLSTYNFTVFEMRQGRTKGFCYTWDQTIAKRGSNDMASCFLLYFDEAVKDNITEFLLFADNCTGQNKNRNVIGVFAYIAAKYNVKIVLRFLVKGHTQNEGDSMHARIERASRNKALYVPSHWRKIMRSAKVKGEPYAVKKMSQKDFVDIKDLTAKQNWDTSDDKQKVRWLDIKEVEVSNGTQVKFKYTYDPEEVPAVVNLNSRKARPVNLANYQFKRAYNGLIPLNESTLRGLQDIMKKKIIPGKYFGYYRSLCEI